MAQQDAMSESPPMAPLSTNKEKGTNGGPLEDDADAHPFFQYYGQIIHQQNMLQDTTRTGTYHQAVVQNLPDFKDKVIMDVGTGSGILAMFAANAGAKRVYAVEASDIADSAEKLVKANGLDHIVKVIRSKVEEVELEEKVDLIISEPMGFLLVHERMLESFVRARQMFMKPGGKMFPSNGTMFFLPFSDWTIHAEQEQKTEFWKTKQFYGVDLSVLKDEATRQIFAQPVVGYIDPAILVATTEQAASYTIDFSATTPEKMGDIVVPFQFAVSRTCLVHGIAGWFDVNFVGSTATIRLDTGPFSAPTHWYQCKLLFAQPMAVNAGQTISGTIHMKANKKYSYDIHVECALDGTAVFVTADIALQDQHYHYLSNPAAAETATSQQSQWGEGNYSNNNHGW